MSTTETLARLDDIQARADAVGEELRYWFAYLSTSAGWTVQEPHGWIFIGSDKATEAKAIFAAAAGRDVPALVAACRDLAADREALVLLLRTIGLDEAPSVPGDEGLWLRTAGGATHRIGPESPAWPAWERARPLVEYKPCAPTGSPCACRSGR